MIQAVMVISTQAKPRLLKFYNFQAPEKHQDLVRSVFQLLSARPDSVSNFVKVDSIFGPGTKMVYKHLATLYFVFVFDSSENELAMLDLIQVFVETLDRCFMNVCELDIVFNFNKLHTILDEMILGGQVIETSSEQIVKSVEEIERLEKQSSTTSFIPKSITEGAFSSFKVPKILQDSPSHRIFRRMHEVLNVGKKITNYTVCL